MMTRTGSITIAYACRSVRPRLQVLQNPLAAGVSGQQVGEFAVDPFTHRGAQQQPPHLLALPLQNLGQQVRGHRALAPGKLLGTLLLSGCPASDSAASRSPAMTGPRRPGQQSWRALGSR